MTGPADRAEAGTVAADLFKVRAGDTVGAASDALGGVYDPELGLDIVSLGLIYDVREEDGRLVVEMTLTTVGCPASESLPDMAASAVEEALGCAVEVEVRLVWDPPWDPSMLSDAAAMALGFRNR
ncbi:MAG: iron-sulfur cluster assembly protein [Actinomycetota bacterium]|nr:iron-sulfur cluster assembly protein [Actinomycetota bacterium]